jgi:NitT/TauT family transport system permease protein
LSPSGPHDDEPWSRRATQRLLAWWRYSRLFVFFVIGLFALWQAIVVGLSVPRYILPAPSEIYVQFIRNFVRIAGYTLVTGGESFVGFFVAVAIGVPLGVVVAFSSALRKTFYPLAVTLEMVPKIAFAPMFVTWMGFGYAPKVIIVFMVCFFPVLLNGILAFTSLSEDLGRFCRSTGAGPLTTFFRVRLPAALPQLFVGIKSAAVNATVGACVSEWVGGDAGLGYYIQIASGDMRMDIGFAAIFVLAALGLLLFGLVVLVERWLIPWHVSQRVSAHIHGG